MLGLACFPKSKRFKNSHDFMKMKSGSIRLKFKFGNVFVQKSASPRIGLITTKKIGPAFLRNLLRRLARETYRCSCVSQMNYDILIVFFKRSSVVYSDLKARKSMVLDLQEVFGQIKSE